MNAKIIKLDGALNITLVPTNEDERTACMRLAHFLEALSERTAPDFLIAEQMRLVYGGFAVILGIEAVAKAEYEHNLKMMATYHGICTDCKKEKATIGNDFCATCQKDYEEFIDEVEGTSD